MGALPTEMPTDSRQRVMAVDEEVLYPMPLYRGTRYPLLRGAPFITLSGTSVPEDALVDTPIGTLAVSNGQGSYAFSIAEDPDSKFQIGGGNNDELRTAAALDFETAPALQVVIRASNSVEPAVSRRFTVEVVDVAE